MELFRDSDGGSPSVFYERANGEKCYLAVHGKAVPNTCYIK